MEQTSVRARIWALAILVVVVAYSFPEDHAQSSVEMLDGAEAAAAVQDLGESVGQAACTGSTPYIYNGGCVATCPGAMTPDPDGPGAKPMRDPPCRFHPYHVSERC